MDQLAYINHYPALWKYIALFPNDTGDEKADKEKVQKAKQEREETFRKVL
jgi:hypothetical protein